MRYIDPTGNWTQEEGMAKAAAAQSKQGWHTSGVGNSIWLGANKECYEGRNGLHYQHTIDGVDVYTKNGVFYNVDANNQWSEYTNTPEQWVKCTKPPVTERTTIAENQNNVSSSPNTGPLVLTTRPIREATIVSDPWGAERTNPNGILYNHRGIDYIRANGNSFGTELHAPHSGILTYLTDPNGYGYHARLNFLHNNHNYTIILGHMRVAMPQRILDRRMAGIMTIDEGAVIGWMGNTGWCEPAPTPENPFAGTHLHYEIRVDGEAQDPEFFYNVRRR